MKPSKLNLFCQKIEEEFGFINDLVILDKEGEKALSNSISALKSRLEDFKRKEINPVNKRLSEIKTVVDSVKKDAEAAARAIEEVARAKILKWKQEEEERLKTEAQKELEKFNSRCENLRDLGFEFNGSVWASGVCMIYPSSIKKMPDDEFLRFLQEAESNIKQTIPVVVTSVTSEGFPWEDFFGPEPEPVIQKKDIPLNPMRPLGYEMGFEACREKVLKMVEKNKSLSKKIRSIGY